MLQETEGLSALTSMHYPVFFWQGPLIRLSSET